MKILIVAAMLLCLSGCVGSYAEIGAGYNNNFFGGENWENGGAGPFGAAFEIGQEWEIPNNPDWRVKCRYMHFSHWSVGPPFNNNIESSLDHVGCAVGVKLSKPLFQ